MIKIRPDPFKSAAKLYFMKDKMLTTEEVAESVFYSADQPGDSVLNEVTIQPESHQMV